MLRLTIFSILALIITGCSTYATDRYSPETETVVELRDMKMRPISVGAFDSSSPRTSISCRAVGPIETPDGETYAEFLRAAFEDELLLAEKYDENSPIKIKGQVEEFTFSSVQGIWKIDLTLESSNGNAMEVNEVYDYETSFYGETACNQTAQALVPAVQNLVKTAVRSDEFSKLVE